MKRLLTLPTSTCASAWIRRTWSAVLDWWHAHGTQFQQSVEELREYTALLADWLHGERTPESQQRAMAWAQTSGARAELVGGRFDQEDRALNHLVHALGGQVFVCAPLWAPYRSGDPERIPVTERGQPQPEEVIRRERVLSTHFQTFEAICGVTYALVGDCCTNLEFGEAHAPLRRDFEVQAAAGLERWLLAREF